MTQKPKILAEVSSSSRALSVSQILAKPGNDPSRPSKKRFKWLRFKKAKLPEGRVASTDNSAGSSAGPTHLDPSVLGTAGKAGMSSAMSPGMG